MTTEEKALALVKKARQFCTRITIGDEIARQMADELERAIEREQTTIEAHEADKKAFSDVAERAVAHLRRTTFDAHTEIQIERDSVIAELVAAILPEPEPDPLDQLLDDTAKVMLSGPLSETWHEALRKAARGYKIERIEQ